jgi:hypothetical protein
MKTFIDQTALKSDLFCSFIVVLLHSDFEAYRILYTVYLIYLYEHMHTRCKECLGKLWVFRCELHLSTALHFKVSESHYSFALRS